MSVYVRMVLINQQHKFYLLQLEMDFDLEFPNSRVNLFGEWPNLSAFIESKLSKAESSKIENCLTPGKYIIINMFPM